MKLSDFEPWIQKAAREAAKEIDDAARNRRIASRSKANRNNRVAIAAIILSHYQPNKYAKLEAKDKKCHAQKN